jgi:glycosyltransferase involved in cell wall biosynthesis
MSARLRVAIAVCGYDATISDPDELLDSYHAPEGWADAVAAAGAEAVTMVQRFGRDACIRRGGVDYRFVADGAPAAPPSWFWGTRMTNVVRELEPSVVHVDGLVFPMVVRNLRMRLPRQTAILVQDHGGFDDAATSFRSWPRRALYRFGLGAADGFLFTASEQATVFLRAGIIRSVDAVHQILESSTDLEAWPVGTDGNSRLPGRPALLWVARLDANKDPLTILDGFERAAATLPDAALTMVYGDDALLPEVKARIAASPMLGPRVHLRGRLPQRSLPALYTGADLFVIGSHHDVACFALLEALSLGMTPVVTDIPPFRAITGNGTVGALFPVGDAEGLGRAIERLAHGDLAAGRALVRTHFTRHLSWPSVGGRALAIYRAAAEARNASPRRPLSSSR